MKSKTGTGRPRKYRLPQAGDRFGKWEIIGAPVAVGGGHTADCRCECGFQRTVHVVNLLRGTSRGCRRCWARTRRSTDVVPGWFWAALKANARARDVAVVLMRAEAEALFLSQDRKCVLTGEILIFGSSSERGRTTASLDRIDAAGIYETSNVRWVHKIVNMMKGTLSDRDLLEWCERLLATKVAATHSL